MSQLSLFGEKVTTDKDLKDRYVVPPFSVFDTRQGYWQERKKYWLSLMRDLEASREGMLTKTENRGYDYSGGKSAWGGAGGSIFDPMLAEIILKWFCIKNGNVLDPFVGEPVKCIVSETLGHNYFGLDIREEQVEINKKVASEQNLNPVIKCGNSNNIFDIFLPYGKFDLCFTSPPYYDLEVYSGEDMSSIGSYDEFLEEYHNIFSQCYDLLNNNRFLVLKVGEIRNKKTGEYRGFLADNIHIMQHIGFKFYNDIVLLNAIGSAPVRANGYFRNRKVVHLHQNILVFYKGDMNKINSIFGDNI